MAYKRELNGKEIKEIEDAGYCIRVMWISPMEGWEYRACVMGARYPFAFCKSPRAAYNAIKKHIAQGDSPNAWHAQPAVIKPIK